MTMTIDLSIDTSLTRQIITGFIKMVLGHAGYSRAVIGLSGGLDSAVSCALAVEALGAENVLAVRMPYKSSNPDSLDHAQLLIDMLHIPSLTIPITDMVDPLLQKLPEVSKIRRGNIMARTRMIVIFDQSEAFQGLVMGTGNKTESLLGYTTIYGDSACALNPIGDLFKTQVRQLSHALHIPEIIINKPPSADLWIGQTDEGELGFTYEEVDKLLYLLVDKCNSPQECVESGFDEDFVQKVMERIRKNQFKRMPPPIARLSNRTTGCDFLYPRDWGL